jgi:hypothetical protein
MGFIDENIFAIIDDTKKYEDAAEQLVDTLFTAPVESEDAPSDDANAPTDA